MSSNNGSEALGNLIEWELAKLDGLDYAIIRATMGSAGLDTSFNYNVEGAQRVGVGTGAYHFFRPDSGGTAQADNFLKVTQGYPLDFFDVDVEPPSDSTTLSPTLYAEALYDFVETFKRAKGFYPAIYTNFESWRTLVGTQHDDTFAKCQLHVAHYTNAPAPLLPRTWNTYTLWQYTSDGRVKGISKNSAGVYGRVDLNRINVQAPEVEPVERFKLFTPFENYVVTSRFNDPRNYSYAPTRKQLHEGEDSVDGDGLGVIYAGREGKIVQVGVDPRGYGNYCILDAGLGWQIWYAHFKELWVKEGQSVNAKQPLGVSGETGSATGVHCHLTLCNAELGLDNYVVKKVVDPAPYLTSW